jgi:glycosyltransferase involved in cell wall biosynthesis
LRIYASHDGGSGCALAWYRMLVPLGAVGRLCDDIEVNFRAGGPKLMREQHPPFLMGEANLADVVVAQRANSFDGMGAWRRMSTPTCRTVYENDDDIWNITPENAMAYENYKEGGEPREVVLRLTSTCNLITCSTPVLGDRHRELTPDVPVVVLPNYIPEFVLGMKHDDRQGRPRIGWMGGGSHARDIHMATGAVRRFMQRFPDWDLVLAGCDYRSSFKCPPDRSYFVPWIHVCDDPDVFYRAIDFDIGICPLLDTQFARSKSHIKALEYMARGIPVVASDVEPYRKFIDHGVNGFLAKYDHEWLKYLSLLASDDDLRLKMSEAAKAKAREHTIEKHYTEWVDAYKMLFPVGWEYKA